MREPKDRSGAPHLDRAEIERLARALRWGPAGVGPLAGRGEAGRLGRAGEFEEYRPWRPGDDLRSLDVRVMRRLRRRVARVDREDTAQPLTVLLDRSASMADPVRERCVRGLLGFLLALARAHGEPTRVLAFVDGPPVALPSAAAALDGALDALPPRGTTDFVRAFRSVPVDPLGAGRVVVVSDAFGLEDDGDVAPLLRHGRPLLLAPLLPDERNPQVGGSVVLRSSEDEAPWEGTLDRATVERYRRRSAARCLHLTRWFRAHGGEAQVVSAEAGWTDAVRVGLERGRWLRR